MDLLLAEPHHDGSALYVSDPAPTPGATVVLHVVVPHAARVRQVVLRSVRDGEPAYTAAEVEHAGDAASRWRVPLVAHNPVTRYRFLLHCDGPRPYAWLTARGVTAHDVPDDGDFRLVAHDAAPDWVADAVVYQVFPDRFARSGAGRAAPGWALPRNWDDPVTAHGPDAAREWYGGDLDGLRERLDHVAGLGATCVYLTPVFEGRSVHRYDAVSFEQVDPVLGGTEALRRLADDAHARGLRLVCDLTTNHTGDGHDWFVAAREDSRAPTASYYRFTDHPDGYESWLGVRSLPKLSHDSPALRLALYSGAASVVGRLTRGCALDGWRIDVANMTGRNGAQDLTHDVARELRRTLAAAAAETGRDGWLLAEHGHDASADLAGDGWHGTMNYAGFTRPVWSWLVRDSPLEDFLGVPVPVPSLPGQDAVAAVRAVASSMSWRAWCASSNQLSSHDTARIRTVVGGGASGDLPAGGAGRARHVAALALLATLPGVPLVFAGDEIGLTGVNGEHSRTPFPWERSGEWDAELLERYRSWLGLRHRYTALRRGGLRWAHVQADSWTFLREHPEGSVLVHVARAPHPPVRLPRALLGGDGDVRVLTGAAAGEDGTDVVLPADGPAAHAWLLPAPA
ncbi:maltodextrin glucosidase [Kineococcus sp. NUM-3379]